jgi:hypothetical protein
MSACNDDPICKNDGYETILVKTFPLIFIEWGLPPWVHILEWLGYHVSSEY